MVFSGKYPLPATCEDQKHQLLSRLIAGFEKSNCHVVRRGDELSVAIPGLDAAVMTAAPAIGRFLNHPVLWDQVKITLDGQGALRYRVDYWTWPQTLLHLAITVLFGIEYCFGLASQGEGLGWSPMQFISVTLAANSVIALMTLLHVHRVQHRVLEAAIGTTPKRKPASPAL